MAVLAMNSAASGLSALSQQMDIIANNLANVNTTAFKSSRANFEDLLYQQVAQPGVENANGDQRPAGLFVGLGTRISNTQFDFSQGSPITTSNNLDLMINGNGMFQVRTFDQTGTGLAYTRAGNFFVNKDGAMVLGNTDGPLLDPPITIPNNATSVQIDSTGQVNVYVPNQVDPTNVGQLQLATFVNPAGLKPMGGNLFTETAASGPPITGNPADGNFGQIQQNALEASNVDSVTELVNLIKTQRAFEMNSQAIDAANQALQVVANLKTT